MQDVSAHIPFLSSCDNESLGRSKWLNTNWGGASSAWKTNSGHINPHSWGCQQKTHSFTCHSKKWQWWG